MRMISVAIGCSCQFGEEPLHFVKWIAGLSGLFRVLEAVGQSAGDQPEPHLIEGLRRCAELGDYITTLAAFSQHVLDCLNLASGAAQALSKVLDHLIG